MTLEELSTQFDTYLAENSRATDLRTYNVDATRAVRGILAALPARVITTLAIDMDRANPDRPNPEGSRPNIEQAIRHLQRCLGHDPVQPPGQ